MAYATRKKAIESLLPTNGNYRIDVLANINSFANMKQDWRVG